MRFTDFDILKYEKYLLVKSKLERLKFKNEKQIKKLMDGEANHNFFLKSSFFLFILFCL